MLSKEQLQSFEKEIADIFATGAIKAPVHLRGGNENYLINIFKENHISKEDYVYGYWDSHMLGLLKGISPEKIKEEILKGNSIALCFPQDNFYCSGIVGSLIGVAVGTAWIIKRNSIPSKYRNILGIEDPKTPTVYHFCGDMSAETGIFFESLKYAYNWDLPIKFIVADNHLSVMTDTREVWNDPLPWFVGTKYESKIIYFRYINTYPHSGLGRQIAF